MFRTDKHHNPTAFTTDVAKEAGLELDIDYKQGDSFQVGRSVYHTALLLGDPIQLTIRVIDKIGYTTKSGNPRWIYINIPKFIWDSLSLFQKIQVIGYHYQHEGGTAMKSLFPSY